MTNVLTALNRLFELLVLSSIVSLRESKHLLLPSSFQYLIVNSLIINNQIL